MHSSPPSSLALRSLAVLRLERFQAKPADHPASRHHPQSQAPILHLSSWGMAGTGLMGVQGVIQPWPALLQRPTLKLAGGPSTSRHLHFFCLS